MRVLLSLTSCLKNKQDLKCNLNYSGVNDEELLAVVGDVAAGLVVNGKTLRCVVKVNE